MKLQKKEKILLFILGFIIVGFLPVYFVTQNLFTENIELKSEVEALNIKQQEFYDMQDMRPLRLENLESLYKQIDEMIKNIADISKSYDAHYAFTAMAAKNNVQLRALAISDVVLFDIPGVTVEAVPQEVTEEGEMPPPILPTRKPNRMQVTINVIGTLPNVLALTDDINKYSGNFILESFVIGDLLQDEVTAQMAIGAYMALTDEERGLVNENKNAPR